MNFRHIRTILFSVVTLYSILSFSSCHKLHEADFGYPEYVYLPEVGQSVEVKGIKELRLLTIKDEKGVPCSGSYNYKDSVTKEWVGHAEYDWLVVDYLWGGNSLYLKATRARTKSEGCLVLELYENSVESTKCHRIKVYAPEE